MSDKYYPCNQDGCKIAFPHYPSLIFHYKSRHPDDQWPDRESCEVAEVPAGYELRLSKKAMEAAEMVVEKKKASPSKETQVKAPDKEKETSVQEERAETAPTPSVYKTTTDPSSILVEILNTYPSLNPAISKEIMSWVEYKGTLHPAEVQHLLTQMAGVPKGAAEIISQKYQLAMNKAAQDGNATVQMTMAGWQVAQPGGLQTPGMPGMMGMPGAMLQPGSPWGQSFGNAMGSQWVGPPANSYWPYPPYAPNPNGPRYEPPAKDPQVDQLREELSVMREYLTKVNNALAKSEEDRRQEAMDRRLAAIEEKVIMALANPPKPDDTANTIQNLFASLQGDMAKMREESANAKISGLEQQLGYLSTMLERSKDGEIEKLKEDLAETRRMATDRPITGRTEMDVVSDLASKVLDTAKEAGKDVKAVVLSGQTREMFNPQRNTARDRKRAGDKLAATVEGEAELSADEDAFLR